MPSQPPVRASAEFESAEQARLVVLLVSAAVQRQERVVSAVEFVLQLFAKQLAQESWVAAG
jgi:hypothetical protein